MTDRPRYPGSVDPSERGVAADLAELDAFDDGRSHSLPGEPEWPVEDVVVEYETGWVTAGYDLVVQPDGSRKKYYWAELPPAVVVVAIGDSDGRYDEGDSEGGLGDDTASDGNGTDDDADDNDPASDTDTDADHPNVAGEVLFVEQYRPTIRQTQLELPAGIVEREETYTEAAKRELREETGFAAESAALLQEVWCTTGLLRHKRGYVVVEGLDPVDQSLDENEFLTPRAVPAPDAFEVARSPLSNEATLDGLLLAEADGYL
ncbi:NUDIX hydrolase [Haloparvum sp. AD34]